MKSVMRSLALGLVPAACFVFIMAAGCGVDDKGGSTYRPPTSFTLSGMVIDAGVADALVGIYAVGDTLGVTPPLAGGQAGADGSFQIQLNFTGLADDDVLVAYAHRTELAEPDTDLISILGRMSELKALAGDGVVSHTELPALLISHISTASTAVLRAQYEYTGLSIIDRNYRGIIEAGSDLAMLRNPEPIKALAGLIKGVVEGSSVTSGNVNTLEMATGTARYFYRHDLAIMDADSILAALDGSSEFTLASGSTTATLLADAVDVDLGGTFAGYVPADPVPVVLAGNTNHYFLGASLIESALYFPPENIDNLLDIGGIRLHVDALGAIDGASVDVLSSNTVEIGDTVTATDTGAVTLFIRVYDGSTAVTIRLEGQYYEIQAGTTGDTYHFIAGNYLCPFGLDPDFIAAGQFFAVESEDILLGNSPFNGSVFSVYYQYMFSSEGFALGRGTCGVSLPTVVDATTIDFIFEVEKGQVTLNCGAPSYWDGFVVKDPLGRYFPAMVIQLYGIGGGSEDQKGVLLRMGLPSHSPAGFFGGVTQDPAGNEYFMGSFLSK